MHNKINTSCTKYTNTYILYYIYTMKISNPIYSYDVIEKHTKETQIRILQ